MVTYSGQAKPTGGSKSRGSSGATQADPPIPPPVLVLKLGARLNVLQVREHLFVEQSQPVPDAEIVLGERQPFLTIHPVPGDDEFGLADLLTMEKLADGFHRLQLEVEVWLES